MNSLGLIYLSDLFGNHLKGQGTLLSIVDPS